MFIKDNNNISIILANPQMGENIGAAARAMWNFGYNDLRIVNPRDGWPNQRAIDMSADALNQMPPVRVFESLSNAIKDLHFTFATTARPRDMVKNVVSPRAAAADAATRIEQNIGFVFGAERTGLTNDEIALCNTIIEIPTNPDFSSLNLGQAVLLMAYELFQMHGIAKEKNVIEPPAPLGDFENFFQRLEGELEDGGFFSSSDLRPTVVRNIRNIFLRTHATTQEINTLQGIVSALIGKKKRK